MKTLLAGLFAGIATFAQAQNLAIYPPPPVPLTYTASVSANVSSPGATISSSFVGISVSVTDLIAGYYQGNSGTWNSQASASSYIAVANLLGSNGVLRIGGSTAEAGTPPALTQPISNNLATFNTALGSGWTVIYDLDLKANDSTTATNQVGFLNTSFGSKVVFSMGQEPISAGLFPNIAAYQTAWNSYYTAIIASVASAKFVSWDESNWSNAQTAINGLTPGVSGLAAVTYHYYEGSGSVASYDSFLSAVNVTLPAAAGVNTTWAGSTPQRIDESNTVSGGSNWGINNAMISATWFLDEAIVLANLGYAGVNIHSNFAPTTAKPSLYNPIVLQTDQNFQPAPIFLGMYLFAQIEGQQILPLTFGGNSSPLTGIATLRAAGKANIIVVNNDTKRSAVVTPAQSAAWSTANVLLINGKGCTDLSPIIGGWAMGESGAWQGGTYSISNGTSVSLPPCGAALISVQ